MRRCGSATASSPASAKALIARLKNAGADGLDAADYPVPEFGALNGADALADGDIKLTNSVLTFARHLAVGRIAPTRVSAEVDYGNHAPEPADVLRKIADARDINAALDSFNPPHDGFRALKAKLAELRATLRAPKPTTASPTAPAIKPGAKDARACRDLRAAAPRRSHASSASRATTRLRQGAVQRHQATCRRAPTSSRPA